MHALFILNIPSNKTVTIPYTQPQGRQVSNHSATAPKRLGMYV